ncbi:hypothetical protein OAJ64_00695 [Pelagibacteraceae bacterium]|nr:hypothetical protein [Pelagibacteraceae bacterium]
MMIIKKIIFFTLIIFLHSCATTGVNINKNIKEKKYYSSTGFALIYENDLNSQGIINKKMDNTKVMTLHSSLKKNTLIKIINPNNSKFVETKIMKNGTYPKIFNIVITKKIAEFLELDENNPYIEVYETKKNKIFVAKEGNIFDEEKQVATNAPVDEIKMDDLSKTKLDDTTKNTSKINKFIILISDFYYLESANNLKNELIKETKNNNFVVKKISNNKYRLSVGPFKNFNALKSTYISLNNLGFEELNIYNE